MQSAILQGSRHHSRGILLASRAGRVGSRPTLCWRSQDFNAHGTRLSTRLGVGVHRSSCGCADSGARKAAIPGECESEIDKSGYCRAGSYALHPKVEMRWEAREAAATMASYGRGDEPMDSTTVPAMLAVIFWLLVSKSARSEILRLLTFDRSGREAVRINWAVAALVVSMLLLVAMEPEARVFLMFIDAVGLDFFLLLLACQLRTNVWLIRDRFVMLILRRLKNCAPFPMDLPTPRVIREFPYLSACAMFGVVVSAGFILAICLPFAFGLTVS